MANSTQDEQFMREALALAAQGCALTSPNPCVGAVVSAATCNIVGRGFQPYDGLKHGEVLALEDAGTKAKGGTLYLNLEPCWHQGRTPPCTDAVIKSGVKRVVAAT